MVFPVTSALILFSFLIVAQHDPGTRKIISCSVTVFNKNIQSKQFDCLKIEAVQDKTDLICQ